MIAKNCLKTSSLIIQMFLIISHHRYWLLKSIAFKSSFVGELISIIKSGFDQKKYLHQKGSSLTAEF